MESKPTELQQIFLDISQVINLLYKVSMTVRNSTPHDRYLKSAEIDMSWFLPFAVNHIQEKFPSAKEYLIQRLAKGIVCRRQYLEYRKIHRTKLAKPEARTLDYQVGAIAISEKTPTVITDTTASAYVEPRARSVQDTEILDEASETTLGSLGSEDTRLHIPSMPKEALGQEPFECPYCWTIDAVENTHAWRRHVFKDMLPYMCTFEHCNTPNELYESRRMWFQHEMLAHRRVWICSFGCSSMFESDHQLTTHMRETHSRETRDMDMTMLIELCSRPVDQYCAAACPLCTKSVSSLFGLRKHIAYHLQELALFGLPSDTIESDEEMKTGSELDAASEEGSDTSGDNTLDETLAGHWAPRVFEQPRTATPFQSSGPLSVFFGPEMPGAAEKLAKEFKKLLELYVQYTLQ